MLKETVILSPHDHSVADALPISRRSLLARGGALGAGSTLGLGLGAALTPTVSHAWPAAPGNITLYAKGSEFLGVSTVTTRGITRKFHHYKCTDGQTLCLVLRFFSGSSGSWYWECGVYRGVNNTLFYRTIDFTAPDSTRWKIVLRDGVSQVSNSVLNTDIDSGRRLVDVTWPYPQGVTVLETGSLAEFSDANTVFWSKFYAGGEYAVCMTVCHLTTAGAKVWAPIRTFTGAASTPYSVMNTRLNTLRNTGKAYADARSRLHATQLGAAVVAVGSVVGAAFFPVSIGAIAGAIVAAGAATSAASIYANSAAIAFSDATVNFNNGWETYCSCGSVVR